MAETAFELEVVTPERKVWEGKVRSVIFPAADGLMGVLPNHAPMLSAVDLGQVRIVEAGGKERLMFVSDGFLQVEDNRCRLLAEVGEKAEDINVDRARESERRARERLAKRGQAATSDIDYARAELALQRALWRLLIGGRKGR